jgi:DNA-directed RNA polymerase specialized sigma24 family protein
MAGADPETRNELRQALGRVMAYAVRYAKAHLRDPAAAENCVEEVAQAVERALEPGFERIKNLDAYLFKALVRRIGKHAARESKLVALECAGSLGTSCEEIFHNAQMRELLGLMDDRTRFMFEQRLQGYKWKEIGSALRISAHIAEQQYQQGLKKLREHINTRTARPCGEGHAATCR